MSQHANFDKITIAVGAGIVRDERDRRDNRDKGHDRLDCFFP
jgi:hypothetical protein